MFDRAEKEAEEVNQQNIRENLDYWHGVFEVDGITDENLYAFADWARNSEWSDKR